MPIWFRTLLWLPRIFSPSRGLQNAENWIFDDSFSERLRYEIDPKWHGVIPVTLLVAADGSIERIEGAPKVAEISNWLGKQQRAAK